MNAVIREKAALTELERKSSYSFYDQLKRDTTEKVKLNVFKIFAHIKSINVAKELDEIIVTRINKLRSDWNISPDVKIIENSDFRIVDMTDELETYTFGTIQKNFFTSEEVKLSDEELDAIDAMNIVLDLDNLPEYIWIRVTSIERWQIDLLQKTAIFPNTYELNAPAISYDIISKTDIENYIKGILKILVPRARYLVFSIIIPNESIKTSIANFVTISKNNVTIQNKTAFMLFERNKLPSESYLIKYIDTLLLPTKFSFKTSDVLRQEFLPQFIDY